MTLAANHVVYEFQTFFSQVTLYADWLVFACLHGALEGKQKLCTLTASLLSADILSPLFWSILIHFLEDKDYSAK